VNGEVSPAGPPDESRPELRASHEDRDRVVETLRVAAGDGRLTAEELDERLESALTARTYRELAVLIADLPSAAGYGASPVPKPKDVMRISRRGGNAKQVGHWVVPKRMEIEVTGGSVVLDFTEAVISQPALQIDAHLRGGHITIITRPGVVVDATEVAMIGGSIHNPAPSPDAPVILAVDVSGEIRGGNIRVRGRDRVASGRQSRGRARRTFWQWLRRQPRRPE
jgi:hypothetical protein